MHPRYPNIFSPIKIGPVELRSRFYASPHAVPHITATGGPNEDFVKYYEARIKGGCSLAIMSLILPERTKGVQPRPHDKINIPAFRAVADNIHANGGKVFGELWYWWGRSGPWGKLSPPTPSFAPSNVQYVNFEKGVSLREMTKGDLRRMREAYRQSAENLREAGFDGIEIHCSHGALMEQFISPYFNRRTDEYGGSLENRMRFVLETLQDIRDTIGDTMALGVRLNCDELVTGGYHTDGAHEVVSRLAATGLVDFFDLDVAIEPNQFHLGMPSVFIEPHFYKPYVEKVRGAAGNIPVLSVLSRVTDVADAEAAIAAGVCDMVGAARALIAEPNLVKNAFEGHEDRSRICIACNWCMSSLPEGAQGCAINPESWNEAAWGADSWSPAAKRSKVIIVGGGPAGLEAARVAALRGHDVTLAEKRDRLGGALERWASLPGRETYMRSVEWWRRELDRLGVTIRLGTTLSAADILAQSPDAVIVATGARYSLEGRGFQNEMGIPGHDRDFVYTADTILELADRPKGRIIVLDGEGTHAGIGISEDFGLKGSDVEYLTPSFSPVSMRIIQQLELVPLMKRMHAAGVKFSGASYIKEIGDRAVTIYDIHSGVERVVGDVAAVVLATARISVNHLEHELEGKIPQLFSIGDAAAARIWGAAAYEGQKFARLIGEPDAPRSIGELYFKVE